MEKATGWTGGGTRLRGFWVLLGMAIALHGGGCIELQRLLQGEPIGGPIGDGPPIEDNDNGDGNDNGGGGITPPTVGINVSSPAPLLNEQVDLECTVIDGGGGDVTFSFDPDARLVVNDEEGTAFFIVTESDLGTEFRFTCTGSNAAGEGSPSNSVSVIPIESPQEPEQPESPENPQSPEQPELPEQP